MTLIFLAPNKLTRPPCCFHWLQDIESYDVVMSSIGIGFVPSFVKISQVTQKLKRGHR
jgi:hypothetical protein